MIPRRAKGEIVMNKRYYGTSYQTDQAGPGDRRQRARGLPVEDVLVGDDGAELALEHTGAPARRMTTFTQRFRPSVRSTAASASMRSPTTTGPRNFVCTLASTTVGSFTPSIAHARRRG
jgi:hypothetical protein